MVFVFHFFFFSSRRRHTRLQGDWSSDVCSSDLDIPALTAAMEGLLADPDARRRMGTAGRKVAETRFGRQRMVSELEDIYGVARGRTQGTAAQPSLPAAICGGQR